ncbi:ribosome small subunit-dependent GTPase A [Candidatus Poribacteria bacterium]|nr:ribosome small subunit-dependent GTPase A [Candidatus Poribacteria bacterium]
MKKLEGLVIRAQASYYSVHTDEGVILCRLAGRLKYYNRTEDGRFLYADPVAVGDKVVISTKDLENGTIEDILPAKTVFSRRLPGKAEIEQIVVTNADQMVAVVSAKMPDMNFRFLDRFIILAEAGELASIVCVNKMDLASDDESQQLYRDLEAYKKLNYRVIYTSIITQEGIDELRQALKDHFTVIVGASGVGKSSLLNAIQPGLGLRVAEVSEKTRKGKHTTTYVELFFLDFGGCVADTPGIREVGLWGVPTEYLELYFPEMAPYLGKCKFNDCIHVYEPGCAIKKAVEEGEISPIRYESYMRLRIGD